MLINGDREDVRSAVHAFKDQLVLAATRCVRAAPHATQQRSSMLQPQSCVQGLKLLQHFPPDLHLVVSYKGPCLTAPACAWPLPQLAAQAHRPRGRSAAGELQPPRTHPCMHVAAVQPGRSYCHS